MRYFKVMMVLALVFAVSAIAYAETQSVKVSGDITLRAIGRSNYDLADNDPNLSLTEVLPGGFPTPLTFGWQSSDWSTFLMSTAEIQIDADLTDNVSGCIRLINQRTWGNSLYANNIVSGDYVWTNVPFTDQDTWGLVSGADAFDVAVDLAYIELKEFLYSPLTLKIGRQDLWFGRGFIIGANIYTPELTDIGLYAREYSALRSFDAVRATLDYDPWTIDAVYAKISENFDRADDDTNLWGVNIGYVFEDYNAEAEAYWFWKQQRFTGSAIVPGLMNLIGNPTPHQIISYVPSPTMSVIDGHVSNDVHTVGLRGSFDPIEDWTIALEGAYQFGKYLGANNQMEGRNRSAWAIDAMIECRFWEDDFAWKPVLSAEYIFYSGESDLGNVAANTSGDYHGWDPMYRGKFDTAIREYQNWFYGTTQPSTPAYTNQHQILIRGSVEPTDSLTCSITYGLFWLAEDFADSTTNLLPWPYVLNQNTDSFVGQEVDLECVWDYTEDVQFSLLTGWFIPGDHFGNDVDDVATDIVGTVKLSF